MSGKIYGWDKIKRRQQVSIKTKSIGTSKSEAINIDEDPSMFTLEVLEFFNIGIILIPLYFF